jgi:hypothetical protein
VLFELVLHDVDAAHELVHERKLLERLLFAMLAALEHLLAMRFLDGLMPVVALCRRVCANRINGAAYAACSDTASTRNSNG